MGLLHCINLLIKIKIPSNLAGFKQYECFLNQQHHGFPRKKNSRQRGGAADCGLGKYKIFKIPRGQTAGLRRTI